MAKAKKVGPVEIRSHTDSGARSKYPPTPDTSLNAGVDAMNSKWNTFADAEAARVQKQRRVTERRQQKGK
jgi:hypothetical protein